MLPTLAIFLGLTGLLIVAVMLFMFVTVLRDGPEAQKETGLQRQWRPPLASAAELQHWASLMAESVTRRFLGDPQARRRPAELLDELLRGATYAIDQVPDASTASEKGCANCAHETIGATAPELLAIADRLRSYPRLAGRVRDAALANAQATADWDTSDPRRTRLTCPLYTADGGCASYPIRPLHCRGVCPSSCPDPTDGSTGTPLRDVARSIGRGAEAGLMEGVAAAGLDATRYELNSGLVAALEADDASLRWLRGEQVFAGCRPCG